MTGNASHSGEIRRHIMLVEMAEAGVLEREEYIPMPELRRKGNRITGRVRKGIRDYLAGVSPHLYVTNLFKGAVQCTPKELLLHLNKTGGGLQFEDEDASIDHIVPMACARAMRDLYILHHWTNMRLMDSRLNTERGNVLPEPHELHAETPDALWKIYFRQREFEQRAAQGFRDRFGGIGAAMPAAAAQRKFNDRYAGLNF